jgi:hypothetical protein
MSFMAEKTLSIIAVVKRRVITNHNNLSIIGYVEALSVLTSSQIKSRSDDKPFRSG